MYNKDTHTHPPPPPHPAYPPSPPSTFHLVLCLVVSPLRGLRLRPPRHHSSRTHPSIRIRDIPSLLEKSYPRFLAP